MVLDQVLTGKLDLKRLNNSLVRFVNNYLLISSNIAIDEDKPYWVKRERLEENKNIISYYFSPLSEQEIYNFVSESFDLERDLLIRFLVIKLKADCYRLIYILPHILIDGLSYNEILLEVSNYFNDLTYSNSFSLKDQVQLHQNLNLNLNTILEENKLRLETFWKTYAAGVSGVDFSFLSYGGSKAIEETLVNKSIRSTRFSYGVDELSRIKQLPKKYGVTPYIYSQLVLGILLHKHTGQESIAISFPVAILEGKELIYGAHINTIFIKYIFGTDTTIGDLIEQTLNYFYELKHAKGKYLPVSRITDFADNADFLN